MYTAYHEYTAGLRGRPEVSATYLSRDRLVQRADELDGGFGQVLRERLEQVRAEQNQVDRVRVGDVDRLHGAATRVSRRVN